MIPITQEFLQSEEFSICILDQSLRTVTAGALEVVTLAIITQKNLDKLIDTNPKSGAKLLKGMLLTVSIRLRKSFDRLVVFFWSFIFEPRSNKV